MNRTYRELSARTGTCELCGGHDMELHILILPDWMGWACDECRTQMMQCYMRQISALTGWTEPGE